ncbi:MAG: type II toxin-antitoxin system VapC family toxin [Candidatus Sulfotelmatobacter sp.]
MVLLDTHVLIWAVDDSTGLSRTAASAIRRARAHDGLSISAVTLWELASLFAKGKIIPHGTVEASLRLLTRQVAVWPITLEIAALAAEFPSDFSKDPADRLIGATARAEGLTLITRDENIRKSRLLKTVW